LKLTAGHLHHFDVSISCVDTADALMSVHVIKHIQAEQWSFPRHTLSYKQSVFSANSFATDSIKCGNHESWSVETNDLKINKTALGVCYTYIPLTLYPRRGSSGTPDFLPGLLSSIKITYHFMSRVVSGTK
jgi:hypothetical protein